MIGFEPLIDPMGRSILRYGFDHVPSALAEERRRSGTKVVLGIRPEHIEVNRRHFRAMKHSAKFDLAPYDEG